MGSLPAGCPREAGNKNSARRKTGDGHPIHPQRDSKAVGCDNIVEGVPMELSQRDI